MEIPTLRLPTALALPDRRPAADRSTGGDRRFAELGTTPNLPAEQVQQGQGSALTERVVQGELLDENVTLDYTDVLRRARAQQQYQPQAPVEKDINANTPATPYARRAISAYQTNKLVPVQLPGDTLRGVDEFV